MPYINPNRRQELEQNPKACYHNAGELTYGIYVAAINETDDLLDALQHELDRYLAGREIRYETFAIVLGCLYSAVFELYRQQAKHLGWADVEEVCEIIHNFTHTFYREHVAPYEDTKIEENGDVTPWQD